MGGIFRRHCGALPTSAGIHAHLLGLADVNSNHCPSLAVHPRTCFALFFERERGMETGGTGRTYDVRTEDIEYLRHGDKPLLARLYRPVGADGARPAVVDVHGGAWTTMDRTQDTPI